MENQKIIYANADDFYAGIEECVKRGLTFEADGSTYSIVLTGGY